MALASVRITQCTRTARKRKEGKNNYKQQEQGEPWSIWCLFALFAKKMAHKRSGMYFWVDIGGLNCAIIFVDLQILLMYALSCHCHVFDIHACVSKGKLQGH